MRTGNGRPPPPRPRSPRSSPPAAGVGPDMTAGAADADSIRGRPGIRGPLGGPGQQAGRAGVDEQVATLLDGAQALLTARGRSWAVLAPGLQEAGALTGEEVLPRLLGLVREVLHARCAALAVAHQGRVLRLLQDEATPASPPPGPAHGSHGLMDRLLDDAQPLRVPSLTTHAAARGWPEPHRTLGSFLGAPIGACGHTIGYLYLLEKQTPDGFTPDDEDLLRSFASTAAPTITSLGLLPDPDGPPPVAGSPTEGAATPPAPKTRPSALQQLVNTARRLTDADAAALVLSAEPGSLQVAAADGSPWADLHGQRIPDTQSTSALAVRQQQTVAVRDAAIDPRTVGPHTRSPGVGPILATPLPAEDGIHGAVSIGRTAPGSPFSDGDTAMMTEFAANAGLAVQLESARREERHDPGSLPERDPQHIAHDLTADLTQRLVVYATTVHSLNFCTEQGRVVGELLRQAEQLHDTTQTGMTALLNASLNGVATEPPRPAPARTRPLPAEDVGRSWSGWDSRC